MKNLVIIIVVIILVVAGFAYFNRADDAAMESTDTVPAVEETTGTSTDNAAAVGAAVAPAATGTTAQ